MAPACQARALRRAREEESGGATDGLLVETRKQAHLKCHLVSEQKQSDTLWNDKWHDDGTLGRRRQLELALETGHDALGGGKQVALSPRPSGV